MAQMLNGLKLFFTGEKAFERQITLFSICGIAGLINGYLSLENQNLTTTSLEEKILFSILLIIFGMFFVGYETIFMHSRELPDITMQSFKIACRKIPFLIFIIGIPFLLASLFTKYQYASFCIETIIAIPLTMLQAGFSYNYNNNEYGLLFNKFRVKEYFYLLIKRLWIVIFSHIITFSLIFIIFFVIGISTVIYFKGDINSVSLLISSQQTAISKLSNYITSILLIYTLSIGVLVWDYELLKTYEGDK